MLQVVGAPGQDTANLPRTLRQALQAVWTPIFGVAPTPPVAFRKFDRSADGTRGSLHVLIGDKKTQNVGVKIGTAWNLFGSDFSKVNHPGAAFAMIQQVARNVQAQIVLLDLHPDLSPLNCTLLMSCDYFCCPLEGDSPSLEALWHLKEVLLQGEEPAYPGMQPPPEDRPWHQLHQEWVELTAHDNPAIRYKIRDAGAKFLGVILNKFTPTTSGAGQALTNLTQGVATTMGTPTNNRHLQQIMLDTYKIAKQLQTESKWYTISQTLFDQTDTGIPRHDWLTRIIGRVPHWGDLNGVSQILFKPAPFVEATDLEYMPEFKKIDGSPNDKGQRILDKASSYRRIFDQIAWNILFLVHKDLKSVSDPRAAAFPMPDDRLHQQLGGPPPACEGSEGRPARGGHAATPTGVTHCFLDPDRRGLSAVQQSNGEFTNEWPQ